MAQLKDEPQLLSASLSSAFSLVLLQLFSRLFTFLLNQALVRLATPQTFGTASIQFELLLSTILFLCREGIRNSLLRTGSKGQGRQAASSESSKKLVENISYLPFFLGVPVAIGAAMLYISSSTASTRTQSFFGTSVAIYAVAAILELAAEPLYIRAQNELRFQVRVRAEGLAVVSKTVVTFLVLAFAPPEWALLAFAVGQAAYGLATLLTFVRVYGVANVFQLQKVSDGKSEAYFDPHLLHLSVAMTGQSLIKHFLTEGDKFLVSYFSPLEDQGGYALASNYGSLVARIIFQPIEETSRVYFSKALSSKEEISKNSLQTAADILFNILLLFTHMLLLLVAFGNSYLPLATTILLPPRYRATSAPLILQSYIYYIPTMAFNGVLEAFFASTATPADLRAQTRWMVVFSIGFVAAAIALAQGLGWGDVGLVWANILNLGVRALYAGNFVRRFFARKGDPGTVRWLKAIPPFPILGAFAISSVITRWSASMYGDLPILQQVKHVGIGVACLVGCLATCFLFERNRFREIAGIMRRKKE